MCQWLICPQYYFFYVITYLMQMIYSLHLITSRALSFVSRLVQENDFLTITKEKNVYYNISCWILYFYELLLFGLMTRTAELESHWLEKSVKRKQQHRMTLYFCFRESILMLLKYVESRFLPWVQNEGCACVLACHWCYILVAESAAKFGPRSSLGLPCIAAEDNNICGSSSASLASAPVSLNTSNNDTFVAKAKVLSGKHTHIFSVRSGNCGACQEGDRCRLIRAYASFFHWKCGLHWNDGGGHCVSDGRLPTAARHWCESRCLAEWISFVDLFLNFFFSFQAQPWARRFPPSLLLMLQISPPTHTHTHTLFKNIYSPSDASGCCAVGLGILVKKNGRLSSQQ